MAKKGCIPWNKTDTTSTCATCGRVFHVSPCKLKGSERDVYGRAKYCSRTCKDKSQVGVPTWNAGLTGRDYKKHFPRGFGGIFYSSGTAFSGTRKEYLALHHWVRNTLGKPSECESCHGSFSGKHIQWANRSGLYLKTASDWIRLCAKCHYEHDGTEKRRGQLAAP